ncbi:MAG: hypothetical protein QM703_22940 [Gemmatales bacterium]
MNRSLFLGLFVGSQLCLAGLLHSQDGTPSTLHTQLNAKLDGSLAELQETYFDLHRNPELSMKEVRTAKKLADALRKLGYEVTEQIGSTEGGFGIVGILKNGDGPTVMIRTDMDALPVIEQTGVPYASQVRSARR